MTIDYDDGSVNYCIIIVNSARLIKNLSIVSLIQFQLSNNMGRGLCKNWLCDNIHSNLKESLVFFTFNCFIPTMDMGTDAWTFQSLLFKHPRWAALTVTWMFTPFFLHAFKFFYLTFKNKTWDWQTLGATLTHFPFVLPILNFYLFLKMGRNRKKYFALPSYMVEKNNSLLLDVGNSSLYESFFEAGPQEMFMSNKNL